MAIDISLVVALGENLVIGKKGKIPWWGQLPADMKHFRELTLYHPVIMGRKTMESLGESLSKRANIVLTRSDKIWAGFISIRDIERAIHFGEIEWEILSRELYRKFPANPDLNTRREILVIGGGEIYRLFLDVATRIYATLVGAKFYGDTFFPELPSNIWEESGVKTHSPDEENKYCYSFVEFRRRKKQSV